MLATSHIEKTDDRLSHATSLSAQHASLESFGHDGQYSSSLNPDKTQVHYSAEPKGLMFEILAMSDIEMAAVAQRRTTPGEKPASESVCLVDDDPMVLSSTGRLLASDGFAVCRFDKGEDFIAYVASHDVPLVVLDIWMQGMNGLEVLTRLCAISPQTHVIVITGHEDAAARITAMQMGTVAFLIKPFDGEKFLEAVHRAIGHAPESSSRKTSLSVPDLVGIA